MAYINKLSIIDPADHQYFVVTRQPSYDSVQDEIIRFIIVKELAHRKGYVAIVSETSQEYPEYANSTYKIRGKNFRVDYVPVSDLTVFGSNSFTLRLAEDRGAVAG